MLGRLTEEFNSYDFCKKLRHYFMDTAPILVDINVYFGAVTVTDLATRKSIRFEAASKISVKNAVHEIISLCERDLFPKVNKIKTTYEEYTEEEKKKLLQQGKTLKSLENKIITKTEVFTITRISKISLTLILKSDERTIKASFLKPISRVLSELKDSGYSYGYIAEESSSIEEILN